jgi:hypothetical protein
VQLESVDLSIQVAAIHAGVGASVLSGIRTYGASYDSGAKPRLRVFSVTVRVCRNCMR